MQSISLYPSSILPSQCRKNGFLQPQNRSSGKVYAAAARSESNGRNNFRRNNVDENMIVLRKRIHEMKMIDRNYEAPVEWMEWEKKCYTSYDEYICEFVGLLQVGLMNSRPCLAIGMIAFVIMSVPISSVVILQRLVDMVNCVVSSAVSLN